MMDAGRTLEFDSQNNQNSIIHESYVFHSRTFTPATRVRIPLGTPIYRTYSPVNLMAAKMGIKHQTPLPRLTFFPTSI